MFNPMFFLDVIGKPWRGKLTGRSDEVERFIAGSYSDFILHYANLLKDKVDAFLLGSELIGLTSVNENNQFPAVKQLVILAQKVRQILPQQVKIGYAADWSEYHHTEGGWYNLDDLWGCEAIDFVGIDAYFPLSESSQSVYDRQELIKAWQSGEGYDFYFADSQRTNKLKLDAPYAWKSIKWWWENEHINPNGAKTKWRPKSKKIWFTEYGFPSVDCCTNQPNVFFAKDYDEANYPYKSKGQIDYKAQKVALLASEDFCQAAEYIENQFLWCWDARPYPLWPVRRDLWDDGDYYQKGHWLQGKLGYSSLGAMVEELFNSIDIKPNYYDVSELTAEVRGFMILTPATVAEI
jgi:hypothetical protein